MTKREIIYNKFDGLCAYTGKPLGNDWQVDHVVSKISHWYHTSSSTPFVGTISEYTAEFEKRLKEVDNIDNLLPALRIVNHYKRSLDLEGFRKRMITFHERLARLPKKTSVERIRKRIEYMYKVAEAFDITPEKPFCGKFYFETKKLFTEEKIMREIKFRGKRVFDKTWVYGSYTAMREDDRNNPFRSDIPKIYHRIWQYEPGDWNMGGYANYEVIPETIGQFTGLKDKNGVEIYEGDILNIGEEYPVEVMYSKKYASFGIWMKGWVFMHYFHEAVEPENCEVIGNIYDNPELL